MQDGSLPNCSLDLKAHKIYSCVTCLWNSTGQMVRAQPYTLSVRVGMANCRAYLGKTGHKGQSGQGHSERV